MTHRAKAPRRCGRATVAQARSFDNADVGPGFSGPGKGFFQIGGKKVIGAEPAGKRDGNGNIRRRVKFVVAGLQAVKLDDGAGCAPRLQGRASPDHKRGLGRTRGAPPRL